MRRNHRRRASQGLPRRQSDIFAQRAALRLAEQNLRKANASDFPSVTAEIGHERSGT
jgi:hypothetical protein